MRYFIQINDQHFRLKRWIRENHNLINGYIYNNNDTTHQIVRKLTGLGWHENIIGDNVIMTFDNNIVIVPNEDIGIIHNGISDLKKIFSQKREKTSNKGKVTPGFVEVSFTQFSTWFSQDIFDQGCYYCGLSNDMSNRLFNIQREGIRHDGTRGGKRGKRLELDRLDPSQPYDNLNNLVWCCYWCNNAKSNFFSPEEFTPIGKEIGKQLRNILDELEN